MRALPDELRDVVLRAAPRLRALTPQAAGRALAPGKWSPQQVLGHLIDSAANNHGRFVRAASRADLCFDGYDQEEWVRVQRYADADWALLVPLWEAYNLHLAWVLEGIPALELERPRERHSLADTAWEVVPADEPVALAYMARDYLGHLCHHLRQIDPELAPEPRLQRRAEAGG